MTTTTMTKRCTAALAAAVGLVTALCAVTLTAPVYADAATQTHEMYRLYNPNSGEHFYTASSAERDHLKDVGWSDEGTGWIAPDAGSDVHRLYNANAGDHHYTMSEAEKDTLVSVGWNYEGVGWKSADESGVALYRQYNPNATAGSHNYTTSKAENDMLVSVGWSEEGIGWYGVGEGSPEANPSTPAALGDAPLGAQSIPSDATIEDISNDLDKKYGFKTWKITLNDGLVVNQRDFLDTAHNGANAKTTEYQTVVPKSMSQYSYGGVAYDPTLGKDNYVFDTFTDYDGKYGPKGQYYGVQNYLDGRVAWRPKVDYPTDFRSTSYYYGDPIWIKSEPNGNGWGWWID